nr:hypothetical protein [Actinomycetales bacterium]
MSTHFDDVGQFRSVLRSGLREAMKGHDAPAVSALRSLLAAIDNAEAVHGVPAGATNESEHVAKAALGVGSAEAERRSLTSEELREILRSEIGERT